MMTPILTADLATVPISLTVILSIASAIVGALVSVIVYLDRQRAAIQAAKDKTDAERLAEIKASGAETRAVLEKVVPLVERVAIEMRYRNTRVKAHDTSDPPPPQRDSELEDTLKRARTLEELAMVERHKADQLRGGG